jgi:cytochrome d ubiquinol oxidase subunit II
MDLHVLWFFILGALLAGYAVLDGFDLGVGTLHLFVARTDAERRIVLNAIGPVWDGNEVWLVTFGGALFAAFPRAYATSFSGFYLPFMFLLFALIFRAVAIEFRSKREERWWRAMWDLAFFTSSSLSALLLGVTVGSILHGVPLDAEGEFAGGLLDLLTPYSLLVGAFTLSLFVLHGAVYLHGKTEGALQARVKRAVWTAVGCFFALYMLTTIATITTVPQATGNFGRFSWAWGIVLLNVLALANIPREIFLDRSGRAFVSSAIAIMCLVALFGLAEFPNLLTSSVATSPSLTIYNASSSEKTLGIMRIVAFLGLPFVVTYTAIVHWVFRGKVRVGKHSY